MLDIPSLTSAFQRVRENHGSAGVDGETIEQMDAERHCIIRKRRF